MKPVKRNYLNLYYKTCTNVAYVQIKLIFEPKSFATKNRSSSHKVKVFVDLVFQFKNVGSAFM